MHKIRNLLKFELKWSLKLGMMEEKTPLSHEVVCFQVLYFETSKSNSKVSKSNSWKNTFSRKLCYFKRKTFLPMFYTNNSSPLLVNKEGFMLIIILRKLIFLSIQLSAIVQLGETCTRQVVNPILCMFASKFWRNKLSGTCENAQVSVGENKVI